MCQALTEMVADEREEGVKIEMEKELLSRNYELSEEELETYLKLYW